MNDEKFGPWTLTQEECKRLKRYDRDQDILSRKAAAHDPIYLKALKDDPCALHMFVNFPKLIAKTAADFILPDAPSLKSDNAETQTRLDALALRSNLRSLAWNAAFWMCGQGDVFLQIADRSVEKDGSKRESIICLRRATGSLARNISSKDDVHARQFLFKSPSTVCVDIFVLLESGKNTNFAFKNGSKVDLPKGTLPEITTQEIQPLAIHIASLTGTHEEPFGESDHDDCLEYAFETANRNRQVQSILDDHAEPPMNLPEGAIDENGKFNPRRFKFFTRDLNGDGAEYISYDPRLIEAYQEIDRCVDLISLLSQTPPALWGRDKDGKAESGRALKFRLLSGLGKARRHGGALREGIAAAARLALRREDVLSGRQPGDYALACTLPGKFISDEVEAAQETQLLRNAGAMSIEAAVEAQGLTGTARDEEVQRIKDESAQVPSAGVPTGSIL